MSPRLTEVWSGVRQGLLVGAVALGIGLPGAEWIRHHRAAAVPERATATRPALQQAPRPPARLDLRGTPAPEDVRRVAAWAVATADHARLPFAVVDKVRARLYVFDAGGRLAGDSPILLGVAAGDHTVPGIGQRPLDAIKPEERTTPAGRFLAEPGRNTLPEDVIWVDYDAAVSMHRVRTTNASERRLQRLASPSIADKRISYGCINVPVAFFETVVWPLMGRHRSVVYVLPEQWPLRSVFPAAAVGPGPIT